MPSEINKSDSSQKVEAAYNAALWYRKLEETNNEAFMPLFFDEHRYLVLKGGGGSGKSIFAGRKILERVTSEEGHRFLVVRKVGRTLRESCFEQLKGQAYEYYSDFIDYIPKGKSSDMYMRFKNGSEIIFAGLDDVEKLKSIYNITGVWIEEASEILESDFNQLDIRLRTEFPYYLQMIITFNPISILHWLKKRFFDFDIKDPIIRQRAMARTRTHESTYKDNRFLRADAIETLENYKEQDPYYYMVYALGMWGVVGKTVFSADSVMARLEALSPPLSVGIFEYSDDGLHLSEISFTECSDGCINIYASPEAGAPYVIGADTAGEGSDYFVCQVLDNRSGAQVATLRGKFDEDIFARQLFCLGKYYNDALIAPEVNFSTYPVMELERLSYKKLYVRESVDDFTHKVKQSYGFQTNLKTRPIIIANLIKVTREDISLISDRATLEEMLTFVRCPDTLRPEAESGAHDDCVMALAIAHHVRGQQSYISSLDSAEVKWSDSQLEDYANASPTEREMLIKRWGRPVR